MSEASEKAVAGRVLAPGDDPWRLGTVPWTFISGVTVPPAAPFGLSRDPSRTAEARSDQQSGTGERALDEITSHAGDAIVVSDHHGHQKEVSADGGADHVPGQRPSPGAIR